MSWGVLQEIAAELRLLRQTIAAAAVFSRIELDGTLSPTESKALDFLLRTVAEMGVQRG